MGGDLADGDQQLAVVVVLPIISIPHFQDQHGVSAHLPERGCVIEAWVLCVLDDPRYSFEFIADEQLDVRVDEASAVLV